MIPDNAVLKTSHFPDDDLDRGHYHLYSEKIESLEQEIVFLREEIYDRENQAFRNAKSEERLRQELTDLREVMCSIQSDNIQLLAEVKALRKTTAHQET